MKAIHLNRSPQALQHFGIRITNANWPQFPFGQDAPLWGAGRNPEFGCDGNWEEGRGTWENDHWPNTGPYLCPLPIVPSPRSLVHSPLVR